MTQSDAEHPDIQLARIEERLLNLTREHHNFSTQIRSEMLQFREQTHEWLQSMVDKLPMWAIIVGGAMCTTIGSMAMYILTSK